MGSNALPNVPPQNLEAEQSLLGSVLLENEALFKALEIIKTEDFYRESHRQIYQAMIDLYEKNEPADLITVTEVLKRKNKLDEVGGASYLADLLEKIPTAANIEYYAKIIRQKSILRSLIYSATEIVSKATNAEENVEDILDFSEKTIFQISEYQIKPSFYPLKTILKSTFKDIERLYEKKQTYHRRAIGVCRSRFKNIRFPAIRSHYHCRASQHGQNRILPQCRSICIAGIPYSHSNIFPGNVKRTAGAAHAVQ